VRVQPVDVTGGILDNLYVTLTFAYMTVSYLTGSKLSTFQALVLSGPYVFNDGCVILIICMLVLTWGGVRAGVCGGIDAMGYNRLQSVFLIYTVNRCLLPDDSNNQQLEDL
jgi:hypothetical protein